MRTTFRPTRLPPAELTSFPHAAVKEILGTSQSVGCTIDGRRALPQPRPAPPLMTDPCFLLAAAHDIIEDIDSGEIEIPSE